MRSSRGMGCISEKKKPGYKKGGMLKRPKAPNKVKGPMDKLSKATDLTKRLGR